MGAALTYGQLYGDEVVIKVAAVTKLTRNLFLAALIPGLAIYATRTGLVNLHSQSDKSSTNSTKINWTKVFPVFISVFVGMTLLRSGGDASLVDGVLVFSITFLRTNFPQQPTFTV